MEGAKGATRASHARALLLERSCAIAARPEMLFPETPSLPTGPTFRRYFPVGLFRGMFPDIGTMTEQECRMPLRMRVHDREPIGLALRRFKKLLERSGIQKELRKRKYYEKPCEARRRAELRKQSAIRKAKTQLAKGKT